jgi:hypothetical protein
MAVPRLAVRGRGRRFGGIRGCACLFFFAVGAIAPAGAGAATPAEAGLRQAVNAAGQDVAQRAGTRAPAVVDRARGAAPVLGAVETTVRQVTSTEPVRSALDAARGPLAAVTGAAAAPRRVVAAAVSGAPAVTALDPGSPRAGRDARPDGGIDRAATRGGRLDPPTADASPLAGTTFAPLALVLDAAVRATRSDGGASSTARSGGDGDNGPLPGPTGTDVFGGPGGIALLVLAILTGLLLLAPRWRSRLLQMSPGHRRSVALLSPIERPG